jgi:DNA modification methylase
MIKILQGNCLEVMKELPDESVDSCITSPPYWNLRSYCDDKSPEKKYELGREKIPEEYVAKMVGVFREVRRVLKSTGSCWLNLGDSFFSGGKKGKLKSKDLVGIPWATAFALRDDGWYFRSDIIWNKKNCLPESCNDRPTRSHEYIFLLTKSPNYYYDNESIKEEAIYGLHSKEHRPPGIVRDRLYEYDSKETKLRGRVVNKTENGITIRHPKGKYGDSQQSPKTLVDMRNKRSVWTVATTPYPGSHSATFSIELITPCVLAGCPRGGTIIDPFGGSGTTGVAADMYGRNAILIELNPEYIKLIENRIKNIPPPNVREKKKLIETYSLFDE